MALINCPECGKQVSSYAEHCINCGYPLNKTKEPPKSTRELLKEIDEFYDNIIHPKFKFENMRLTSDWKLW